MFCRVFLIVNIRNGIVMKVCVIIMVLVVNGRVMLIVVRYVLIILFCLSSSNSVSFLMIGGSISGMVMVVCRS